MVSKLLEASWNMRPRLLVVMLQFIIIAPGTFEYAKVEATLTTMSHESCEELANNFNPDEVRNAASTYSKRVSLEKCIVNHLQEKYAKQESNLSLWELPPVDESSRVVELTVRNVILSEMGLNEVTKEFVAILFYDLVWTDPRLRYNIDKWKLKQIQLDTSQRSIWAPQILKNMFKFNNEAQMYGSMVMPLIASMYCTEANLTSEGVVSCRSAPTTSMSSANCQHDLESFPNDKFACCTSYVARYHTEQIRYKVESSEGKIHRRRTLQLFLAKAVSVSAEWRDGGGQTLQFCISGARHEQLLRIEVYLPIAIAAVVCFVSPILPTLQLQIQVKLFALLLQFLCFEFLFESRPQLAFADEVPKVHRFYEFTMATTITSLLMSFFAMLLLNCKQKTVPPHRSLLWFANCINNCCGCIRKSSDEISSSKTAQVGDDCDSPNAWFRLWIGLYNAFSLLLIVTYVLGLFVVLA